MEKTGSFRDEDYNNNRRVFLRSYPLQWSDDHHHQDQEDYTEQHDRQRLMIAKKVIVASVKSRFIAVINWSEGKVLLLRRCKDKVAFYLVACHIPFGIKHKPDHLITI